MDRRDLAAEWFEARAESFFVSLRDVAAYSDEFSLVVGLIGGNRRRGVMWRIMRLRSGWRGRVPKGWCVGDSGCGAGVSRDERGDGGEYD